MSRQLCYCEACNTEFSVPLTRNEGVWSVVEKVKDGHATLRPDCATANGYDSVRVKNCAESAAPPTGREERLERG